MLKLKKVAITGGLSCGKSSVCRILKELGAYVVSADNIVHQLLSSDANLGQQIVTLLGPSIWVNNQLDRSSIAKLVFHDQDLLQALEKLIHPAVYREITKQYQEQCNRPEPPPLFVAEVPLLFESNWNPYFDKVVALIANEELCCQRFCQSTGNRKEDYYQRMKQQMPPEDKALLSDYIIRNDGTLEDLKEATQTLFTNLSQSESYF
jgi:dephospho-CoA kinase